VAARVVLACDLAATPFDFVTRDKLAKELSKQNFDKTLTSEQSRLSALPPPYLE
jgi:hypothetical protein